MAVLERKEKKEEEKPIRTGFEPLSPLLASTPFAFMRHFFDDFERFFEGSLLGPPLRYAPLGGWGVWAPALDVFERNGQLVARIDLPGLTKEDVKVDVTEEAVDVSGERKEERKEEREGYYRAERGESLFATGPQRHGDTETPWLFPSFSLCSLCLCGYAARFRRYVGTPLAETRREGSLRGAAIAKSPEKWQGRRIVSWRAACLGLT